MVIERNTYALKNHKSICLRVFLKKVRTISLVVLGVLRKNLRHLWPPTNDHLKILFLLNMLRLY